MKNSHWREIVEALGGVCIVAVLLLIAVELRESNRVAARVASATQQQVLMDRLGMIQMARASDPEVAKLFAKLTAPKGHLITATDTSQINAVARQYLNIYQSAQVAFENDLLSEQQLAVFAADLENTIKNYPGLKDHLIDIFDEFPAYKDEAVFAPLATLAVGGEITEGPRNNYGE
jgi:hypothetical protein